MRAAALVAIAVLTGSCVSAPRSASPQASVTFTLRPDCTGAELGELALAIYKDGLTSRVVASDKPGRYQLYNKHEGNLIEVEAIRLRLDAEACVLRVNAVTEYFRPWARVS